MSNSQPFLTDVKTLRERARQHIEQGAVTAGYNADRETVLKLLNEALATEIVCTLRYKRHYYMADGLNASIAADEFLEHAQQEQQHADWLAERIVQLGGAPNFSPEGLQSRSHAEYVEGESRGLLSIERIRKDFSTGNDLAPATLRDTANGIRAANIPYIAVGTLDVGMRDRDPASGNTRVFVTVTGKVLDVTGRFPRTVSSVGPVQFSGTGPNETVARTNALQLAAEKAAQQMINELNVKAVR